MFDIRSKLDIVPNLLLHTKTRTRLYNYLWTRMMHSHDYSSTRYKKQYCVYLAEAKQNYRILFFLRSWHDHTTLSNSKSYNPLYCASHTDTQVILISKDLSKQDTSHSVSSKKIKQFRINGHWYKHTPRTNPEVQYAFKILMTHWILQFALSIAVRSVFHRCASLDIHCWKLYFN